MKASVVLAHPYHGSFNHAIYKQIMDSLTVAGIKIFAHDLYVEGFNPVMTVGELGKEPSEDLLVQQYADEMMQSDLLFFVHPNWWGQPPAILKGWVDRVVRPPYAYDLPEGALSGLPVPGLDGKYAVVYNTSNTEEEREVGYFGDPLENIWKQCICGFCGIEKFHRRMFRIVSESSETERNDWLSLVDEDVKRIAGE
ncbi:MAG: NAD(P)H-dependent oxidoreductase [Spirochaetales bacterium]|uniref:NAD(P)H-dependent oxidoreductase n=1 Tax=Candidatus Thalassospirochaeta sargassi TaxID=3119039 RepID=A0AAJ1IJJ6_9SPIO|nr:NAD(P)H-dependent oxidoreductase [Spirochaetales bacterium]